MRVRAQLLPRHRYPEAYVGLDVVVGVRGVVPEIDSYPVDLAVEGAGVGGVIRADGGACLAADVGRLVGREDEALGLVDAAAADFLAVVVERDIAALAHASAIVVNLHAPLAGPGWNSFTRLDIKRLDAQHVVME